MRPAVSRALTVFGVTNAFTLARSPVLHASNSSLRGSVFPDPDRESAFVNVDLRPAILHRHFHATVRDRYTSLCVAHSVESFHDDTEMSCYGTI